MSVHVDEQGHVMRAIIDRPEARNAIDFETMESLETILDRLEAEHWRVFVLRGAGAKSFVSGGDLKKFAALQTASDARGMATRMVRILERIERLPCWTFAALNGSAYGGGVETALAFDFRFASRSTRLGFAQVRFDLVPGWGGLTRLVECVGRATAVEWLSTGAVVNASDALSAGLLHRIADDVDQAILAFAEPLKHHSREFIAALKNGAMTAAKRPRDEAIAAELEPFCELWARREHHEKVRQFLAHKKSGDS